MILLKKEPVMIDNNITIEEVYYEDHLDYIMVEYSNGLVNTLHYVDFGKFKNYFMSTPMYNYFIVCVNYNEDEIENLTHKEKVKKVLEYIQYNHSKGDKNHFCEYMKPIFKDYLIKEEL